MAQRQIIIIGAGMAGLVAAAVLSRTHRVLVVERSDRAGGKVRQARIGAERIDCGPTVFTLREVFEDIFAACGEHLDDHVTLREQSILARHFWPDGSRLDLHASPEKSAAAIADFAGPAEADRYCAFLRQAGETWETLFDPFIRQEKPSFPGLIARAGPRRLSKMNPYATYADHLDKAFSDPRLRQLFGRYATYSGCSPYAAPATLMLIAHIEQKGVFAVDGGMAALAEALEAVATQNGARFLFDTDVEEILVNGGAAQGIRTADGDVIGGDAVLFNGDVSALAAGLAGPAVRKVGTGGGAMPRTQSAVTVSFRGTAEGVPLALHNVFFSDDYRAEFRDTFEHARVPANPTVYLFAPDADRHTDAAAAARYFCLVNAPADGDTHHYTKEEIEACRTRIFDQLEGTGLTLRPNETEIEISTPTDFARRFPATGGALFGRAMHGWRASFDRPGIRTKRRGLYCAGGSVHPGSGVPMAALSGLMAAQRIMADHGSTVR